jgi:O-antigen/teichoic acid export membrane protein
VSDVRDARGGNLARALWASGWFYGSRALVFAWALLLAHEFGVGQYGLFAMALAFGTMVGTPIDSYFMVRTPRVSDDEFEADRSIRVMLGMGLVFVGWLLWPFTFVGGFAVGKAGIDVCFQASRSSLIRAGRPERAQRSDAIRQVVGVVLGATYVWLYPGATMETAALVYLGGLALPILTGIQNLVTHAPHFPKLTARNAAIVAESVGGVTYAQAGVILLGLLTSTASAGYYSFGLTVVIALSSVGLSFGTTFHRSLRDAGGHPAAGPSMKWSVVLSSGCAVIVAIIALGLWIAGTAPHVWLTFAILAPVAFTRTFSTIATVVLMMQHRDYYRLAVTLSCLTVVVATIVALAGFGGPGAAAAFLVADVLMAVAYGVAAFRPHQGSKAHG